MLTRRIAPPPPLNPEFSLAREEELLGAATSQGHAVLFSFEQDYEERTAQSSRAHAAAQAESQQQQRLAVLRAHLRLSPGFPSELRADVVNFKAHIMREEEDDRVDSIVLATKLAAVGYDVVCRRALGASAGGSTATTPGACFHLLQYEFLIVKCNHGDYQGMELYVDPHFREQFEIPHATPHYAQLLSAVPVVFVGSRVHLIAVVKLLCAAMAESFATCGLTLAPWRRTSAMLSKWQPLHAKDTPFTSAFHATPPAQQQQQPPQQAEENTWLPFGASAPVAPKPTPAPKQQAAVPAAPKQQQQQQECPFAAVRQRKAQEDVASQLANLDAWCNRLQASPCAAHTGLRHAANPTPVRPAPGPIAATAASAHPAATPHSTATAAAAPIAPMPISHTAPAAAPSAPQQPQKNTRPTSPTPSPTSPRSPSSGGKAISLLSSQLLQRSPSGNSGSGACVQPVEPNGTLAGGVSPVALGAAHQSQPVLRKVQYVQRC